MTTRKTQKSQIVSHKKNLKTFLFRESYSTFWLNSCVTFALLHCPFFIFSVLYFFVIGLVGLCCKPQPLVIIIIIITVGLILIINQQETQLSLTNRATQLEISQGHQTWYRSICWVWFPISVLCNFFWDIRLVTIKWPWNPGRGHSRSSEPTQIDPPSMTSY